MIPYTARKFLAKLQGCILSVVDRHETKLLVEGGHACVFALLVAGFSELWNLVQLDPATLLGARDAHDPLCPWPEYDDPFLRADHPFWEGDPPGDVAGGLYRWDPPPPGAELPDLPKRVPGPRWTGGGAPFW